MNGRVHTLSHGLNQSKAFMAAKTAVHINSTLFTVSESLTLNFLSMATQD